MELVPDTTVSLTDAPVLLLRIEEAAARLGIARTLMYHLVRTGEVESVHVGRLRRVPVACLEEYVAALRARPSAAGE
ncbi:helix-turn-helix domain-containing protein [Microlunatus parietis]|uniref:Excisionase family DNA binding protein n=2 Tax=Microlunatus parietis TaxID=682979 RepID=A0A7Y9I7V1_9ACTN|nr:excisionase family DNA binding protein [Microlunatus parietis]